MSVLYSSCISSTKNVQQCTKTCKKFAKTCISSTNLSKNVYLKYSFIKKCVKMSKDVQKRVKTFISSTHLSKNVQKRAKMCKIVQKHAKTCKNVHLKYFWTQFKNVHLRGPCSLRPCISRPYCISLKLEKK